MSPGHTIGERHKKRVKRINKIVKSGRRDAAKTGGKRGKS